MGRGRILCLLAIVVTCLAAAGPADAAVTCGKQIKHSVTLTADLGPCPAHGLVVIRDDVTINLNGHDITGTNGAGSVGIQTTDHKRVKIVGLEVDPSKVTQLETGIRLTNADFGRVQFLDVSTNDNLGIALQSGSDSNRIKNNTVSDNAGAGIVLTQSDGNRIKLNTANDNQFNGIQLFDSNNNKVKGNTTNNDGQGGGAGGIALLDADGTVVDGNTANDNGSGEKTGIYVQGNNVFVTNNTANLNDVHGIHVTPGYTGVIVANNTANQNGDGADEDGIRVESPGTQISGNHADNNFDNGIQGVTGVIDGGGNTATGNGGTQCVNVTCP
jgi:parallel beta-helix repeat protein